MLLCQINPKRIVWSGAPQNDPRKVSLTLYNPIDWEFNLEKEHYSDSQFNDNSVYFFVDVCNFECRLACFIGRDVDFINDPESAGISAWDMERYIIRYASLLLSGWYPISKTIQAKLMEYYETHSYTRSTYAMPIQANA
jgi:hypothetical protein